MGIAGSSGSGHWGVGVHVREDVGGRSRHLFLLFTALLLTNFGRLQIKWSSGLRISVATLRSMMFLGVDGVYETCGLYIVHERLQALFSWVVRDRLLNWRRLTFRKKGKRDSVYLSGFMGLRMVEQTETRSTDEDTRYFIPAGWKGRIVLADNAVLEVLRADCWLAHCREKEGVRLGFVSRDSRNWNWRGQGYDERRPSRQMLWSSRLNGKECQGRKRRRRNGRRRLVWSWLLAGGVGNVWRWRYEVEPNICGFKQAAV